MNSKNEYQILAAAVGYSGIMIFLLAYAPKKPQPESLPCLDDSVPQWQLDGDEIFLYGNRAFEELIDRRIEIDRVHRLFEDQTWNADSLLEQDRRIMADTARSEIKPVDGRSPSPAQDDSTRTDLSQHVEPLPANPGQFFERFRPLADSIERTFGIPAEVSLGMAFHESAGGTSTLFLKTNNLFGLKCWNRARNQYDPPGHCVHKKDDEEDPDRDRFFRFTSPEASFFAYARLLQSDRYRKAFRIPIDDFERWLHQLKASGYATDPDYPEHVSVNIRKYLLAP